MTYFLDFDRTLFDTDAFNASLVDEPGCAPFADVLRATVAKKRDDTLSGGAGRQEAWRLVSEALLYGDLTFPPGHLSRFLYPEVLSVLEVLATDAVIMTYGDIELQRVKIKSALPGLVARVIYTGDKSKAVVLAEEGFTGTALFIDDRAVELAACAASFPELTLFEIRRDGRPGDGRWPVIRSLQELPVA